MRNELPIITACTLSISEVQCKMCSNSKLWKKLLFHMYTIKAFLRTNRTIPVVLVCSGLLDYHTVCSNYKKCDKIVLLYIIS